MIEVHPARGRALDRPQQMPGRRVHPRFADEIRTLRRPHGQDGRLANAHRARAGSRRACRRARRQVDLASGTAAWRRRRGRIGIAGFGRSGDTEGRDSRRSARSARRSTSTTSTRSRSGASGSAACARHDAAHGLRQLGNADAVARRPSSPVGRGAGSSWSATSPSPPASWSGSPSRCGGWEHVSKRATVTRRSSSRAYRSSWRWTASSRRPPTAVKSAILLAQLHAGRRDDGRGAASGRAASAAGGPCPPVGRRGPGRARSAHVFTSPRLSSTLTAPR